MDVVEKLAEIARTRPEKLKKEKEKGIKIVGYTGRFVPEELIYAAGAVPYLMCRGGEPEPPDPKARAGMTREVSGFLST